MLVIPTPGELEDRLPPLPCVNLNVIHDYALLPARKTPYQGDFVFFSAAVGARFAGLERGEVGEAEAPADATLGQCDSLWACVG